MYILQIQVIQYCIQDGDICWPCSYYSRVVTEHVKCLLSKIEVAESCKRVDTVGFALILSPKQYVMT